MLFNSVAFAFFFPIVAGLYFLLPHRFRWGLLLGASCGFYMWFRPEYVLILGFTIVVDYFAGLWIERMEGVQRRWALGASLAANVGVLAVFKYWNFAQTNLGAAAHAFGWNYPVPLLEMALPIGLSFHTFQAMSYTIEVYRGNQRAERHFGIYALYVMFFPQLVAGPIERPQNLLHQFREKHTFDPARAAGGLRLMAWGLFKKICVADRLSVLVNSVYADPRHESGPWLVLATLFFALQIYCDFSGYSDIAIGSARVLGFTLMKNFNRPYEARSVGEFWRRWHISLSTWFRDYVYVPLGGNRVSDLRRFSNLLVVFLLSGLWHGAKWTYVIWGGLHGLFLVMGMATKAWRDRLRTPLAPWIGDRAMAAWQRTCVIGLVCIGWVFFRAASLRDALDVFAGMSRGWAGFWQPSSFNSTLWRLGYGRLDFAVAFALIGIVMLVHRLERQGPVGVWLDRQPGWRRWTLYYAVTAAIFWLAPGSGDQFIYFQF